MTIVIPKKLVLALLLVAVAGLTAFYVLEKDSAESLVRVVETRGSRVLGTRVNVAGAKIGRRAENVALDGLEVANPPGFGKGPMISISRIDVRTDPAARVLWAVKLTGVEVLIEFRGTESNLEMLGERVTRSAANKVSGAPHTGGASTAGATAEKPPGGGAGTPASDGWRIRRVDFSPVRVSVRADWTKKAFEMETGAFSIQPLDAGTDDLVRAIATRFIDKVLISAAREAKNERVRQLLMSKVEKLRARLQRP